MRQRELDAVDLLHDPTSEFLGKRKHRRLTGGACAPTLPPMSTLQCHHCGAPVEINEPLARDAECEACKGDLRCCIDCRHYDTRMNNSCTETQAEIVEDKARRNFCEFFFYSREPFVAAGTSRAGEAKEKLERMFKNPPGMPEKRGPTGKAKLDELFNVSDWQKGRATDARKKLDDLFSKPADEGGKGKEE